MLTYRHHDLLGEDRLYIKTGRGEAWIARIPRRHPDQKIDWKMWVRPSPGEAARTAKSPLRVEIESQLRSWLLRRHRRCLRTLDFAALCAISEGRGAQRHN